MKDRRLVVVGGGISGLAAAWEAARQGGWQVTVLEADDRPGGKIRTSPFAGRLVDEGADAFLRRVPDALDLCREVGLDELISPTTGSASIWVDGALRPIPTGTVLGVPVDLAALEASGVVSAEAVARAVAEGELSGTGVEDDVALGPYLREHLGDEIVDRLVSPLVGGIYAGEIDDMSLDASTPQLADAARRGASLRATLAARPAAPSGPVFAAPPSGMSSLVDHLVVTLGDVGAEVVTRCAVDGIEPTAPHGWRVSTAGGALDADGLVVALPPGPSAGLLRTAGHPVTDIADTIGDIGTASVVLVTLAHDAADLDAALVGSGFLVPRTEQTIRITAVSWFTSKWGHLARDDGKVILRVSLGHATDRDAIEMDDAEVLATIARDLERTMGVTASPTATRISRWRDGFPQFRPGHLDRIAAAERFLAESTPSLGLAGAMMQGVGIPACIRQGRSAARRLTGR